MADTLKFDTTTMRAQAKKLDEAASGINKATKSMLTNVETLRKEWVGDGATALLGKLDADWQEPILSYAEMLRELAYQLSAAADKYDGLKSEYAQIQAP